MARQEALRVFTCRKARNCSVTVPLYKKKIKIEIILYNNIHYSSNLGKDTLRLVSFPSATGTFQGQTHWWLNYFFYKMTQQTASSYTISPQLHLQPNPFLKFSWKPFGFYLYLWWTTWKTGCRYFIQLLRNAELRRQS